MSLSSVKNALLAAFADKTVTLEEAENVSGIAARTNGVDKNEAKAINGALGQSAKFAAGAKELLTAVAADRPAPGTPLAAATKQVIEARGIDVLSGLAEADGDTFSDAMNKALEAFADLGGNKDVSELRTYKLKVGAETVIVASNHDFDKHREIIGFFDTNGKELQRAAIDNGKDPMTMCWLSLGTNKKGAPIGTPTVSTAAVKVPSTFKKDLETYTDKQREDGNDFGKDIETKNLPPILRRRMEFMERTIADPTGAQTFVLNNVRVYMLGDYSCVSSEYFYTADGVKHFEIVG